MKNKRKNVDYHLVSELYKIGLNDREIGERVGCSDSNIQLWRSKNGLRPNGRINYADFLDLYNDGMSDLEIGKKIGKSKMAINELRRKNGLPPNKRKGWVKKKNAKCGQCGGIFCNNEMVKSSNNVFGIRADCKKCWAKRNISVRSNRRGQPYNLPKWSVDYIFEYFDNKCAVCGNDENLSIDHIVPVNPNYDCKPLGTVFYNIMPLCRLCNSSKSNNEFYEWLSKKYPMKCNKIYGNIIKMVAEINNEYLRRISGE
jgi:transposase